MSNRTYNIILTILILVIIASAYVIFTREEYTEDLQVTEPVSMNVNKEEKPAEQITPTATGPLPTFGNTEPTPTPTPEKKPVLAASLESAVSNSETVHYSTTGFSPQTLTIKRGTRVTFINDNEQPMWVASAPYPSHSNYPSFDERHAVMKDGLYSFTFTTAGGYNYQNDRNPAHSGTIIVTE